MKSSTPAGKFFLFLTSKPCDDGNYNASILPSDERGAKRALNKLNFLHRDRKMENLETARFTEQRRGGNFYEEKWVMELFKQN